jgi:hypothetical protein
MDWNLTHRDQNGKWRILAASLAWQRIDSTWLDFGTEHWNLILGLGMGDVNSFKLHSSSYNVWLVTMVNYNLPLHLAIDT